MSYANYDDVVMQLRSAGLVLDSVRKANGGASFGELYVGSTKSVRCDVDGEKKRGTGAYWLHELHLRDGIWLTGSYWVDHGNTNFKLELNKECSKCGATMPLKASQCSCGSKKSHAKEIPAEQLEAHRARMAEARKQAAAERAAEIEKASRWATAVWRVCREAQPGDHDYLARKQLSGTGGARILESNEGIKLEGDEEEVSAAFKYLAKFHGALVIPACDENGRVYGLQFILSREKHKEFIRSIERDKAYWPSGMAVEGHYWMIGGSPSSVSIEVEGYATGLTVHEETGLPVAVAFAANNLGPVAENLRKRYKRANILIGADDDWVQRCDAKQGGCGKYTPVDNPACIHCGRDHGKKNPGVESAMQAALKVKNTAWIKPVFADPRPEDKKGDTDFNDLRVREGCQVVRAQFEAKLQELGWGASPAAGAPRAGVPAEGGGERVALKSMLTLDEAVERFAMVYGGSGTMFDFQEHMLVPKSDVLDILPEHGWRDMRAVKKVVRMDEVGFDPAGTDPRIKCNLWGGWPTRSQAGKCDLLLELLEYLCCNEENARDVFAWVLRWLAYPIKNPGAKMRTALVLHGPQGTGKNLFFESIMAIYGEYGRIVDQAAIEDKFNDWASRKLFLIADEVVARQELFHIKNKLKGFVTGEWIRINPKNVSAHDEKNHVNLVFLSNESQPLVLERDDRRYTVIHTPEKATPEFYSQVRAEIEAGGIAALHDYLLNLDMAYTDSQGNRIEFDEHTKPPATKAKDNLIELSLDSVGSFLREWQHGEVDDAPFCPCLGTHLYDAYRKHCDKTGERAPRSQKQFIGYIKLQSGWRAGEALATLKDLRSTEKANRKMVIPPNELLVKTATKERSYAQSEGMSQAEWLAIGYHAFATARGIEA